MEDRANKTEPLNPYARAFLGFWALASLVLLAFRAEDPDKLFILFGDATNTQETYGSGRFCMPTYPVPTA